MAKKKSTKKEKGTKEKKKAEAPKAPPVQKRGRPKRAVIDIVIECPYDNCGRKIRVKVFRDIIKKQVPAEVELVPVVDKELQGELFDDLEKPQPAGKKVTAGKE